MVEHYRSDFNITDIVHIKKKEKKSVTNTQVAQFALLISLLFVKYFKTFFFGLHHEESHKNRNERCFKILDCLQACLINQRKLHLMLVFIYTCTCI